MRPWPGNSYPLGASYDGAGTNFALFSEVAEYVELCLFDADGTETVVRLPEVDGFEATERIRALTGIKARIPIIALTADAMRGIDDKCVQAGMDDYVSKPIEPALLLAKLDARRAGVRPGLSRRTAADDRDHHDQSFARPHHRVRRHFPGDAAGAT